MSPDTKVFLELVESVVRIGIAPVLLLMLFWAGIRYLPKLSKSWAAQARQADILSETLPNMERCMEKMASDGGISVELMQSANNKLDELLKLARHERV